MKIKLPSRLKFLIEKEDFSVVSENVEKGVLFSGTNLYILFFAILVASLGLNTNSTAVVIGAMLISPLMGPIVGIGVGVETNDVLLIRKALRNYAFAAFVGLFASTIYFLLSPIQEAHSEILSRTQPTIYDVLIAFFGGFAGIIAIASKQKGNVIPGVAIATALMPPVCTAGYGLATLQWSYFFGASYLYIINSVFIAVATTITAYVLKLPKKKYTDPKIASRGKRIIWIVVVLTLLPSIYLGYDIVQQNKFTEKAARFIKAEAIFPNDYLLRREIDAKNKTIALTFGGKQISETQIKELKRKLKYYDLENSNLEIKQGFSFLKEDSKTADDATNKLSLALKENENQRLLLQTKADSLEKQKALSKQVFKELRVQYPDLTEAIIQPVMLNTDTSNNQRSVYMVSLHFKNSIRKKDELKLANLLKLRLNNDSLMINMHAR